MTVDPSKRYVVEWTPWSAVSAAATKLGWKENDSAADFVEINDFRVDRSFFTFDAAVNFARLMTPLDTWACPLIHRQELITHDTDDLGQRVKPHLSWDTDASWECCADDKPDEASPSYREVG